MWSRDVEIMIGCWLAMSPFIFGHSADQTAWWINDFASALTIVLLAGFSYWKPMRYAHLGQILVGVWLIGFAYSQSWGLPDGTPAAMQNAVSVGLLLTMFGLIPNDASDPPLTRRRAEDDSANDQAAATSAVQVPISKPRMEQVEHV